MSLTGLVVEDFRCVERAELEFDQRCNLISGANASGKTSLLEAIFFLGRGRSFRTARTELLIRQGSEHATLAGRVRIADRERPLGMRVARDGLLARFAGRPVASLAELATVLPAQAIDPEVHRLVEGGPQERRRYLDWGVFHVEPDFVDHWRRYQRALRQRNAALRQGQAERVARAWDQELIESGNHVSERRGRYAARLAPYVAKVGERLLGQTLDVAMHRGWAVDHSLEEALSASWSRDRERGLTHSGPHRADVAIRFAGLSARDRVSRGQQKLAAAALLLAQLRCDADWGSPVAALLVDDPAAELDAGNLDKMLKEIVELPAQLFVTALERTNPAFEMLPAGRWFHVEHGSARRLK
jgi:DNA replication and repair protein RecF